MALIVQGLRSQIRFPTGEDLAAGFRLEAVTEIQMDPSRARLQHAFMIQLLSRQPDAVALPYSVVIDGRRPYRQFPFAEQLAAYCVVQILLQLQRQLP
ncbi:hypothetical protein D3C76_1739440 [compost metagenome]